MAVMTTSPTSSGKIAMFVVLGLVIAVALTGVATSGGYLVATELAGLQEENVGHVLVADAGSSHTDFTLYKSIWRNNNPNSTASNVDLCCHTQLPYFCSMPPLSESLTSEEAQSAVAACLAQAVGNLTQQDSFYSPFVVADTPIVLRATAGARMLNETNPDKMAELLNAIINASAQTLFLNAGQPSVAEILSGADEGAFNWIASNFLEDRLTNAVKSSALFGQAGLETSDTIAALDLGGASTQITFVPTNSSSIPEEDIVELTLYGNTMQLYSHSYLCYGVKEAQRRREALFIAKAVAAQAVNLTDPCLPTGFTKIFEQSELDAMQADVCLVDFVDFAGFDAYVAQNITGLGEPIACNVDIKDLFDGSAVANAKLPLTKFKDAIARQPDIPKTQIYAVSNYFYTASFMYPECSESCNPSLDEFQFRAATVCMATWEDLRERYPDVSTSFLPLYCSNALYIVQLLTAFGLELNSTQVKFTGTVKGTDVGWNFGLAVNATGDLPSVTSSYRESLVDLDNNDLLTVLGVSVGVLVVAIVATIVAKARTSSKRGYADIES
eukprot:m.109285 g.109285  ORF g.109285 m.109285 type:complete len:556 (+) comp27942_c0_seq1:400-2067(+)